MKSRAAVAYGPGQPLVVEEVDLEGPHAGEVLVEIKATGVCHTDEFTRSGADPEGLFPVILGHEGAGVVVEVGKGVTSVKPDDHVIPLYTPECRQCKSCTSHKTNLCTAIRATQGKGLMPDGTSRFSLKGKPIHHYMGCSTFSNFTVLPEIALAKIRPDAPFDKACYIGCGVTTGVGAVIKTAKVEPGAHVVVFGLGGIGLNVVQGARLAAAAMIVGVDLNPKREKLAQEFGLSHFVNPKDVKGDLVAHLVELTGGGADYSFECVGNVDLMRQALECTHRGWGVSVIISVAGAGQEIKTRPFQLVTGRVWKGTAFGGVRGRTEVPGIVDWYMDGRIAIDPLITHKLPLDRINEAFDLMHAGESIRTVIEFEIAILARASFRSFKSWGWSASLAHNIWPFVSIWSPPFRSDTMPPASRTRTMPAATSQGWRPCSQKPSKRPAATKAISREAAPMRRMPALAFITAPISAKARSWPSLPMKGTPVAITEGESSLRAATRRRLSLR